jgi:predicted PurR-regulated permease PerM
LQDRASDLLSSQGSDGGEAGGIASSAFGAAATALEVVSGAGIALFATIFFVHDGPRIWAWVTSLFPPGARAHVDDAGQLSWSTLSSYARGTVVIAAIDAAGIGVGAWLIGVPLAGTIAVLVFFFSFIPIVGALLSGLVAVLIALATQGLTAALLMLVIVILVQQLEGHILQPVIQGKLVAIHPLAVVLAVAGGSIVAGLIGAVIAVPIVAVANVLVRYTAQVSRRQPRDTADPAAADPNPVQTPAS